MTDCLAQDDIEKLLAGKLSPDEQTKAEAHIGNCPTCFQLVDQQRNTRLIQADSKPPAPDETRAEPSTLLPGADLATSGLHTIPGYEIQSEIHRGGQGIVFKAVQKATKRVVALKLLLQGPYATPRQRLRFEREVDLAASLHHPNIVTVYDSGVTPDGLHFLAMEYIAGDSLDRMLLKAPPRSVTAVLELFGKICAAVNYAHQRGVIHRDLKPANICVDAAGEPHVLDFGLAKIAGTTDDAQQVSNTGEFVGTLTYASPEQTRGDPRHIDIRTDVYSLGVILYQMLTGRLPYSLTGSIAAILQQIAEAEPRPLVTRSRSHAGIKIEPLFVIDEQLEAIVLKALAKDKEQRYQSAGALGQDIAHYLAGEPVQARPPGVALLLRVWFRKNFQTALWPVVVGIICGLASAIALGYAALPTWLHIADVVYTRLPTLEQPWQLSVLHLEGPWRHILFVLGAVCFLHMGLFSHLLVRPQNRLAEAVTGLATGLVAGITGYTACLGWMAIIHQGIVLQADVILLTQVQENASVLTERYPDLEQYEPERRIRIVAAKMIADIMTRLPLAIWYGIFGSLAIFGTFGTAESIVAGMFIRARPNMLSASLAYLEVLIVAALVICWFMPLVNIGRDLLPLYMPDGVTGNIGLILVALAIAGLMSQWHGAARVIVYIALLLNLLRGGGYARWEWPVDALVYGLAIVVLAATAVKSSRPAKANEPNS